jgi:hypothetical protein
LHAKTIKAKIAIWDIDDEIIILNVPVDSTALTSLTSAELHKKFIMGCNSQHSTHCSTGTAAATAII